MQNHHARPLLAFLSLVLAALAFIATPLPAQDVTVTPPALFDSSNLPFKPDTPPTLLKEFSPVFPDALRTTTEPGYAIVTQHLNEKGVQLSHYADGSDAHYEKSAFTASSHLLNTPAQKHGKPSMSFSWLGVIYNPASASENTPDSTPRLLKVSPVFITLKQWIAFPKGPRVVRATIEIDATGAAKNPNLENNASFAKAVLPALKRSLPKWHFAPARKNGQPVNATLTLNFVLQIAPSSEDKNPEIISQERPIYPDSLKDSGIVGNVLLDFVVDTNGNATEPTVMRSNSPGFEAPAIDAILQWKFTPGIRNGRPVHTRMRIPIIFHLFDEDGISITKTAYDTPQPGRNQTAKMPGGLRYDVPPKPYNVIYPVYPYEMLRDGKTGEASVAVLVTAPNAAPPSVDDLSAALRKIFPDANAAEIAALLGKTKVVVINGGGPSHLTVIKQTAPEFGHAVLAACEYFRFTPAKLGGKPTNALATITQTFDNSSLFVTDEDRDMLRLEQKSPGKIVAAGKLDAVPKRIVTRQPPFPLAARQENLTEGKAVVEFLIDTEGKVRLPRIISSTHPSFGYMSVQTVANWRYEPPKSGGKPVVTRVRVPFNFTTTDTKSSAR